MTRLTCIRRMFEIEQVHKSNHTIPRGRICLSMFVEVDVLDNTLEVPIDKERLIFRNQKCVNANYDDPTFKYVAVIK